MGRPILLHRPHCPVETRGYELTRDDRGKTRAYVRLFNLSGRRVRRLEGQVHFEGPEGEQSLPLAQDVDAAPRQMFTLTSPAGSERACGSALPNCALRMAAPTGSATPAASSRFPICPPPTAGS